MTEGPGAGPDGESPSRLLAVLASPLPQVQAPDESHHNSDYRRISDGRHNGDTGLNDATRHAEGRLQVDLLAADAAEPLLDEPSILVEPDARLRHNIDVEWEGFAPVDYWKHNYSYLREDDRKIIRAVGEFFVQHFRDHQPSEKLRGIDVGSGSNLYPALAMLPWCEEIHLRDVSPANVAWLRAHTASPDEPWAWQLFWEEFQATNGQNREDGYSSIADPEAVLAAVTAGKVKQGSIFNLAEGAYGIGTMFFVAESMTSYEKEFDEATESFIRSLAPGAPFAAAFMDGSVGYVVADKSFPAVRQVNEKLVTVVLEGLLGLGAELRVTKVQVPSKDPLRDGYDGMIIAVGTTAPA